MSSSQPDDEGFVPARTHRNGGGKPRQPKKNTAAPAPAPAAASAPAPAPAPAPRSRETRRGGKPVALRIRTAKTVVCAMQKYQCSTGAEFIETLQSEETMTKLLYSLDECHMLLQNSINSKLVQHNTETDELTWNVRTLSWPANDRPIRRQVRLGPTADKTDGRTNIMWYQHTPSFPEGLTEVELFPPKRLYATIWLGQDSKGKEDEGTAEFLTSVSEAYMLRTFAFKEFLQRNLVGPAEAGELVGWSVVPIRGTYKRTVDDSDDVYDTHEFCALTVGIQLTDERYFAGTLNLYFSDRERNPENDGELRNPQDVPEVLDELDEICDLLSPFANSDYGFVPKVSCKDAAEFVELFVGIGNVVAVGRESMRKLYATGLQFLKNGYNCQVEYDPRLEKCGHQFSKAVPTFAHRSFFALLAVSQVLIHAEQ